MDPQGSRVLVLSIRMAATLAIVSILITSCNMPQLSSSENGASDTDGPYASNEQALQVAAGPVGCPRSRAQMWYLCLGHSLSIHLFTSPGTVDIDMGADPCVGIPVRSGSTGVSGDPVELPVTISGQAEDEDERCAFEGQNTITVVASGDCRGTGSAGAETLSIQGNWGIAQVELHCECKGEGDCHPYNGPIQLPQPGRGLTPDPGLRQGLGRGCSGLP